MDRRNATRRAIRHWRQWTECEARRELEELASTGESAAGFARRKGISPHRVAYWQKRLSEGPRFVAVEVESAVRPSQIEISVGAVVLRVREGLDVEHVARLVDALERRRGGAC
jgi:hypothetical protein